MSGEAHFGIVTVLRLSGGGAAGVSTAFTGTLVRFTAWADTPVPGRIVEFTGETATSRQCHLARPKLDAMTGLLAAFCSLGRPLEVSPVIDTSDGWTDLVLEVAWNGGHNSLHLTMESSGFDGPDAPLLQRLLADIEDLAGVEPGSLS